MKDKTSDFKRVYSIIFETRNPVNRTRTKPIRAMGHIFKTGNFDLWLDSW